MQIGSNCAVFVHSASTSYTHTLLGVVLEPADETFPYTSASRILATRCEAIHVSAYSNGAVSTRIVVEGGPGDCAHKIGSCACIKGTRKNHNNRLSSEKHIQPIPSAKKLQSSGK